MHYQGYHDVCTVQWDDLLTKEAAEILHFTYDNLKGTHMMAVRNWK